MATSNSAYTHKTSYLVKEQVPGFVRSDHPRFVQFLESYYEYLQSANTGIYDSVSNNYFMGPTYFNKKALEYLDLDTTDFDRFLDNFKAEFSPNIPKQLETITDKANFYKNILGFYRAKGSEESFKVLFRLLYGEEIELYYPNRDILTLSGGTFLPEVRVRLGTTDNIEDIVGRIIYGANSGVYATVERIERVYDDIKYPWRDPTDRNDSVTFAYLNKFSISNTTITQTEFDIGEVIHTGNVSGNHVNTIIHASPVNTVFFDDFSTYANVNYLLAISDNRGSLTNSLSRNIADPSYAGGAFDESVNVFSSNTGHYDNRWFDWRSMLSIGLDPIISDQYVNPGITFVSDESASGGKVMVIGNDGNTHGMTTLTSNQNTEDLVELIHTTNIKIDPSRLYKFSVRVKDPHHWVNTATRSSDSGGPQTVAGPYFNSGYSALRSDGITFNDQQGSSYTAGEHWILSSGLPSGVMNYESDKNGVGVDYGSDTQQANSWTHDWRIFQAYATGSNTIADTAGFGNSRESSNTIAVPIQNVFSYIYSPAAFHANTSYIRPLIQVEQAFGDNANTGGSQFYVDYYKIEEMGTIEPLTGTLYYLNESSRLSTKSAVIQDNAYYQQYAYDIRTKQNLKDYSSIVEKVVHPAGFKRYGTKLSNSVISSGAVTEKSSFSSDDIFSPISVNSLAGWWSADALTQDNIQYRKWSYNVVADGLFGTNTNRLPVGHSVFEENVDYASGMKSGSVTEGLIVDYAVTSTPPNGGIQSLQVTDLHSSANPRLWMSNGFITTYNPYQRNVNYGDDEHPIILESNKKWLISCYGTVSNLVTDSSGTVASNAWKWELYGANTTGAAAHPWPSGTGSAIKSDLPEAFSAKNTWERKSAVIDLSGQPATRYALAMIFPNRTDWGDAFNAGSFTTGNTFYLIDGLMVEEYDPAIHQSSSPYTPSPFVLPGINGANVISWYDQSFNKHHVYANTHGDLYFYPQYITNAVHGMPAIRFSANTVKGSTNVYPYSSFGGTVNSVALELGDATNFHPPTSGFQATKSLASNTLTRPVSNTWTIMSVVKTNLTINSTSYLLFL